jgi:hypothetical protein
MFHPHATTSDVQRRKPESRSAERRLSDAPSARSTSGILERKATHLARDHLRGLKVAGGGSRLESGSCASPCDVMTIAAGRGRSPNLTGEAKGSPPTKEACLAF